MNRITDLIHQFRSEDTRALEDMDKSRKPEIVLALKQFADDDVVIDFLLAVASNEEEFDLARIEVLRIFEFRQYRSQHVRNRIARVIYDVLSRSDDDYLVRNYAAMAAANYMDNTAVNSEINRILHDKAMDSDLRWNAFAAVAGNVRAPRSIDSLRRLLEDEEFKESAARVLSEREVD